MLNAKTELELEIRGRIDDLDKKLGEVDRKLSGLQKGGKKTGDSFSAGFKQALPAMSKATIAIAAVGAAYKGLEKAITSAMAKQTALAEFSAITGVVGDSLDAFGDAADDLAVKFGTKAVDNITSFKGVLSRLGPDFASSTEAVKLMGENINTLAIASGLDATQAMDALTTAMLQFGVDLSDPLAAAQDAEYMMNVMAAAAKEGAAEVPQLSEALVQAGVTAKNLGVSFEETVAALETLAAGGKTGAEAGVALRNVMASLTKVSKMAEADLRAYGLRADELGRILTTKGVNAAMDTLNRALDENGTEAEDAALMARLFGKENMAAGQILAGNITLTDKYTSKIQGTNTAHQQAATMLNTVQGRWSQLSSKWDVIIEKIGTFLLPALEAIINNIATTIEQIENFGSAVGDVFSGDFGSAWDKLTGKTQENTDASEGAAKGMREVAAASDEAGAAIVQQTSIIADLQEQIKALEEHRLLPGLTEAQIRKDTRQIQKLQERLDALMNPSRGKKAAASAKEFRDRHIDIIDVLDRENERLKELAKTVEVLTFLQDMLGLTVQSV